MKLRQLSAALAGLTMLTAAFAGPAVAQSKLTMWHYGGCDETCLVGQLVDVFETANPDIDIELVPQPGDSYFQALLAASLTGTGPDIGTMWPGGYMTPYKPYLADLHEFIPAETIESSIGTDYFSEGYDSKNVLYASPTENQWYNGFYNKKLFADHGVAVPTTWDELKAACETFKAANVTCIINGSSDAQFNPVLEFTYLATAVPLSDWGKLYNGELKYNNPALVEQLQKWQDLYTAGYLNSDALNNPTALEDFVAGKAAMMMTAGSWNIAELEAGMGDNVGVLIPPYSDTPINAVASTAGQGIIVTSYAKDKTAAGKFAAWILSDEGQTALAKLSAPTRPGFTAANPLINELAAKSSAEGVVNVPMFDNFTQPGVTDAIYRNVALVLINQMTPTDALAAVDAAFDALPPEQKQVSINLGQ